VNVLTLNLALDRGEKPPHRESVAGLAAGASPEERGQRGPGRGVTPGVNLNPSIPATHAKRLQAPLTALSRIRFCCIEVD